MLSQFTKMAYTQSTIRKHALLTLTNNLFITSCSAYLPIIILHFFTNLEVSVIKRRKDILLEIKCSQKVTGRLTFDLLTQKTLYGFLFPFIV